MALASPPPPFPPPPPPPSAADSPAEGCQPGLELQGRPGPRTRVPAAGAGRRSPRLTPPPPLGPPPAPLSGAEVAFAPRQAADRRSEGGLPTRRPYRGTAHPQPAAGPPGGGPRLSRPGSPAPGPNPPGLGEGGGREEAPCEWTNPSARPPRALWRAREKTSLPGGGCKTELFSPNRGSRKTPACIRFRGRIAGGGGDPDDR